MDAHDVYHTSVLHPVSRQQHHREKREVTPKTTRCGDEGMACPRSTKRLRLWGELTSPSPPCTSCAESQILNALPHAIISDILFGYLDKSPKQLSLIRKVCTTFRSMARASFTELCLRDDLTRKINLKTTYSLTKKIINQFTNLKEIDFSFCAKFGDRHLELLLPIMRPSLRVLKLRRTKISDEGVMKLFGYDECPDRHKQQNAAVVHAISGRVPPTGEHETELRPSVPLEVLDLSENGITNQSLLVIANTCSNLKHLSLSMCTGITDKFTESVPLFLVNLSFLDLSNCSITSRGCCHLARLPALHSVDISGCSELSGNCIEALVTGAHSPLLACDGGVSEIDEDQRLMRKLSSVRDMKSASRLTSIAARFAKNIDANLLSTLVTYAPMLHTLDLRHYRGNDFKIGFLSPLKISLRKLRQNGTEVAFSRCQGVS